MNDCIFCGIVAGKIPAQVVYENANSIAFLDIKPNNPGHTLVIPKEHTENIYTMQEKTACEIIKSVKHLAPIIKKAVEADGINIAMNNERAAGQVIFHAHVHIIPRFNEDGLKHWRTIGYKSGEAETIAEKIRSYTLA